MGTLEINLASIADVNDDTDREDRLGSIAHVLRRTNGMDPIEGGNPADVILSLPVEQKIVHMRARRKVVVDEPLLTELRTMLQDEKAIRLRGRRPSVAPRKKRFNAKRQRSED